MFNWSILYKGTKESMILGSEGSLEDARKALERHEKYYLALTYTILEKTLTEACSACSGNGKIWPKRNKLAAPKVCKVCKGTGVKHDFLCS